MLLKLEIQELLTAKTGVRNSHL